MNISRTEKKGLKRLLDRENYIHYSRMEESYFKEKNEMKAISEKRNKEIENLNKRYSIIVNVFMNEIAKRKISVDAPEFDEKMEEILQTIIKGKLYTTRFPNDDVKDVRNAILRKVNEERRKNETSREK